MAWEWYGWRIVCKPALQPTRARAGPHIDAVEFAAQTLASTTPPAARCIVDEAQLAEAVDALLSDQVLCEASRCAALRTARSLERGLLGRVWRKIECALRLPPLN